MVTFPNGSGLLLGLRERYNEEVTLVALHRRWDWTTVFFVGIAALWGLATALLADASGWNRLIAPASAIIPLAAFGWTRRGRESIDVLVPALLVAYATYLGLAVARVRMEWELAALADQWPAVLFAGVPFTLIMTVFVTFPVSLIPRRARVDAEADRRFWAFVRAQNAARPHTVPPLPRHENPAPPTDAR